jgi:tRNA-dihydrouridine synthase B
MKTFDDVKKPIKMGSQVFSHRIIQGPLAGISCSAFRKVVSKYGNPAFTMTEMISAKSIINLSKSRLHRYLHIDPSEGPVVCQLSGDSSKVIGDAIDLVSNHGFMGFDINAGCPMPKVRKQRCGSWWMDNPDKLCRLLDDLRKRFPSILLGVKVRLSEKVSSVDLIKRIESTGVNYVTVHGRTWRQHYETPCNITSIGQAAKIASIPIIGNGDVCDHESLVSMIQSGVDAVMVARASIGNPELPQRLLMQQKGRPDLLTCYHYFCEHLLALAELVPEKVAIQQSQRWLKSYLGLPPIEKYALIENMNDYFDRLLDQLAAKGMILT